MAMNSMMHALGTLLVASSAAQQQLFLTAESGVRDTTNVYVLNPAQGLDLVWPSGVWAHMGISSVSVDSDGSWYATIEGVLFKNGSPVPASVWVHSVDVSADGLVYLTAEDGLTDTIDVCILDSQDRVMLIWPSGVPSVLNASSVSADPHGNWYAAIDGALFKNGSIVATPGWVDHVDVGGNGLAYLAIENGGDETTDIYVVGADDGIRLLWQSGLVDNYGLSSVSADREGNWYAAIEGTLIANGVLILTPGWVQSVDVSAGKCTVPNLHPLSYWEERFPSPAVGLAQVFESSANPATCQGYIDIANLAAELRSAVQRFRDAVRRANPNAGFQVTSGFRPVAYQAHLYEIRQAYLEASQLPGIESSIRGRRPYLEAVSLEAAGCRALIEEINREVGVHCLVAGAPRNAPAVNPPGRSLHEIGRAIDIRISGVADHTLKRLALASGLHRPCGGLDRELHYQLLDDSRCSR